VPKIKSSYTAEFKRKVLAYQTYTDQSQKEVATHFSMASSESAGSTTPNCATSSGSKLALL